ncbi:NfeD family protein [Marinibactrum halimedae]|uniref:NfeD-like C-terminal domain-containing protein n=1 Tax=Marinibactrum halimedae TaxID=1444977 RepID=A0AA37T3B0_9GAMM|nr:NfeD family protein [Marinibactrum halimedae]MCD9461126.1 NfeD family protein [Marinibactrum halimedae]GLS24646.1 hypothetical protein GCM10007877_03600 [Marinibactrum halimedae]
MTGVSPFLFYLFLGAGLIAIELLVFQLSVFWLLFIGFGAIFAALIAWAVPEASWVLTTSIFASSSLFLSVIFYKPLQRWNKKPGLISGNDAIGKEVSVISPITSAQKGKVQWSGADWQAELEKGGVDLAVGDNAVIVAVEGIHLIVRKK